MSQWCVLHGDVRERLTEVAPGSVQTCVTSPPYWGLRDYGTASWDGGDPACDHLQKIGGTAASTLGEASGGHAISDEARVRSTTRSFVAYASTCGKCGARRIDSQIGLEATPDAYVAQLVAVFRLVRAALKDDGTLWLNLGDSYAGSGPSGASYQSTTTKAREGKTTDGAFRISKTLADRGLSYAEKKPVPPPGLKSKDLVGIPWRVAFALQADGWYLRSDIIWSKPNPMPESVTDRPTKAHEYLFLLSKQASYYYDAGAIADAALQPIGSARLTGQHKADANGFTTNGHGASTLGSNYGENTRNKRSVWHIATQPFPEAHFATYPEKLIEPCILAGSRVGDTVLDPFTGSGTTGAVAVKLGRAFVGCELNADYLQLARRRIGGAAPLFSQERPA